MMSGMDLHLGDCLGVMRGLPDASVDSVVTDPPAGIGFMGKEWDSFGVAPPKRSGYKAHNATTMLANGRGATIAATARNRDGFVAYLGERMAEALRVAKPGAHALVWALPRTSHWTALALEDAGWLIEDRIAHHFGQGFPKHRSKLKPATEDWWLCTKPGGAKWLNVDGCRVGTDAIESRVTDLTACHGDRLGHADSHGRRPVLETREHVGRWPSNLALTHHPDCNGSCVPVCPVAEMDRQSGERKGDPVGRKPRLKAAEKFGWSGAANQDHETAGFTDSGGASRYFPTFAWEADDFAPFLYCAKASRSDRGVGNTHPTVKPLALMRWLVRLVTPTGGTVLDPFLGSGTTGLAAFREGFRFIGAENDPDSFEVARRRLAGATAGGRQATFFEA